MWKTSLVAVVVAAVVAVGMPVQADLTINYLSDTGEVKVKTDDLEGLVVNFTNGLEADPSKAADFQAAVNTTGMDFFTTVTAGGFSAMSMGGTIHHMASVDAEGFGTLGPILPPGLTGPEVQAGIEFDWDNMMTFQIGMVPLTEDYAYQLLFNGDPIGDPPTNTAPEIAAIADLVDVLNQTDVSVQVDATDADGDALTYELTAGSPGAIDANGLWTWTTQLGDGLAAGMADYTVGVIVNDGTESVEASFGVSVVPEPGTVIMLLSALAGLGIVWRKRG